MNELNPTQIAPARTSFKDRVRALKTRIAAPVLALVAAGANAQTTGGGAPDMTAVTTAASSQFTAFLTTNGPALIGILMLGLGFKLVIKFIRRGVSG